MNFTFQYAPKVPSRSPRRLTSEYRLAGICSSQYAIQEYPRKVDFVIAKVSVPLSKIPHPSKDFIVGTVLHLQDLVEAAKPQEGEGLVMGVARQIAMVLTSLDGDGPLSHPLRAAKRSMWRLCCA